MITNLQASLLNIGLPGTLPQNASMDGQSAGAPQARFDVLLLELSKAAAENAAAKKSSPQLPLPVQKAFESLLQTYKGLEPEQAEALQNDPALREALVIQVSLSAGLSERGTSLLKQVFEQTVKNVQNEGVFSQKTSMFPFAEKAGELPGLVPGPQGGNPAEISLSFANFTPANSENVFNRPLDEALPVRISSAGPVMVTENFEAEQVSSPPVISGLIPEPSAGSTAMAKPEEKEGRKDFVPQPVVAISSGAVEARPAMVVENASAEILPISRNSTFLTAAEAPVANSGMFESLGRLSERPVITVSTRTLSIEDGLEGNATPLAGAKSNQPGGDNGSPKAVSSGSGNAFETSKTGSVPVNGAAQLPVLGTAVRAGIENTPVLAPAPTPAVSAQTTAPVGPVQVTAPTAATQVSARAASATVAAPTVSTTAKGGNIESDSRRPEVSVSGSQNNAQATAKTDGQTMLVTDTKQTVKRPDLRQTVSGTSRPEIQAAVRPSVPSTAQNGVNLIPDLPEMNVVSDQTAPKIMPGTEITVNAKGQLVAPDRSSVMAFGTVTSEESGQVIPTALQPQSDSQVPAVHTTAERPQQVPTPATVQAPAAGSSIQEQSAGVSSQAGITKETGNQTIDQNKNTSGAKPEGSAAALEDSSSKRTAGHEQLFGLNGEQKFDLGSGREFSAGRSAGNSALKDAVFQQIAARLQDVDGTTNQIRINLKPASLGNLDVALVVENGRMTAKIVASSLEVRDVMAANISEFKAGLENRGLQVQNISLSVRSESNSQQGNPDPRNMFWFPQPERGASAMFRTVAAQFQGLPVQAGMDTRFNAFA